MRTKAKLVLLLLAFAAFAATAAPYRLVTVAEGLDYPWCVAFLPDGAMLVTEIGGTLRRISPDGEVGEPITGVPKCIEQAKAASSTCCCTRSSTRTASCCCPMRRRRPTPNATEVLRARLESKRAD